MLELLLSIYTLILIILYFKFTNFFSFFFFFLNNFFLFLRQQCIYTYIYISYSIRNFLLKFAMFYRIIWLPKFNKLFYYNKSLYEVYNNL